MMRDRRFVSALLFVSLLVGLAGGCASVDPGVAVSGGRPKASGDADAVGELAASVNAFGFDLVEAASEETSANVIVSPLSVHANLSMLAFGASGETAGQMRSTLHVAAMSDAELGESWAALLRDADRRSSRQTLEVANALWVRDDIVLAEPFLEADRQYFGSRIASTDLRAPGTIEAINGWAEDATNGEISDVVEEIPADAILCLMNAVYFEGEWVTKFDSDKTRPEEFTLADGTTTTVNLMQLTEDLPYHADETLVATRLEYRGGDSAYYVFLPEPGVTIDEALAHLADGGFEAVRESLAGPDAEVVVGLPKLELEYSSELAPALSAMGMPSAFDPTNAGFAGLATNALQPVSLATVLHQVKVSVDEEGTKAAAITFSVATEACADVGPIVYCDRPYVFAIVDEPSGAILFLGVVNDPSAESP